MKNIVWLASYPKSGNTWLRLFLANYLAGGDTPVPLNQLDRFATGDALVSHYRAVSRDGFDPGDDRAALRLRDAVLRAISSNGADVNLVKTHNKNRRVDGVRLIPPHMTRRALYVVRNPLDMLLSYADHYGTTPAKAANEIANENNSTLPEPKMVRQFLGSWSEHVTSWTKNPRFPVTVLKYEDMSDDPTKAFSTVLHDLGAPADEARVAQAVRAASFDEAKKQESASGFVEKSPSSNRFFRSGKVGEGRATLDPAVIGRIVADHGEVMRQFGYET